MKPWAPIVFAPTFRVDYRLIAVPPGLAQGKAKTWLTQFVRPTLDAFEVMENPITWALFQNAEWRVFGIACRASALASKNEERVQDDHARPLAVFAGFAAPRAGHDGFPLPAMCDTKITPFEGLYEYVTNHWEDERASAPEEIATYPADFQVASGRNGGDLPVLNTDVQQIALWPDAKGERTKLWRAISASTVPLSLLLGIARQRHAVGSPYLNGTLIDSTSVTLLAKASAR